MIERLKDDRVERFAGGITWYMMESKDFILSITPKLKNENYQLKSFSSQRFTFKFSFKEIQIST